MEKLPPNPKVLYTEKIEKAFLALKPYEYFVISDNVKPESRDAFVEIVKWMIDHQIFKHKKLVPEFKNDYSAVRMINYNPSDYETK